MADATTVTADIAAALVAVQAEMAGLRQSLALMLETQAMQSEMLGRLLEAAAAPGEAESTLADTLRQILGVLARQAAGLEAIQSLLLRLPQDVGETVAAGVREALSRG